MILPRPCRISRTLAAACAVFLLAAALSMARPALAQGPMVRIVHLDPERMSAADRAVISAHRAEIAKSAEVYGYSLVAGNWTYRQTLCAPMAHTILLHYSQRFPDGTESLFTALVPQGPGRVQIVPVLHRNATPFVPAPRNPRNYALFNSVVPQSISARELISNRNWIELSACYAEMTGADIKIPKGGSVEAGVAEAPTATIHLDSQHHSLRVTFADRESETTFRVWNISYNNAGRVTAAETEVYAVSVPQAPSQPNVVAFEAPEADRAPAPSGQRTEILAPASAAQKPRLAASTPEPSMPASSGAPTAPASASELPIKAVARNSQSDATVPGWKFIPESPQPPSRFIPQAPPPPTKIVPQPPNE